MRLSKKEDKEERQGLSPGILQYSVLRRMGVKGDKWDRKEQSQR